MLIRGKGSEEAERKVGKENMKKKFLFKKKMFMAKGGQEEKSSSESIKWLSRKIQMFYNIFMLPRRRK